MHSNRATCIESSARHESRWAVLRVLLFTLALVALLSSSAIAFASEEPPSGEQGQASSGELLFYPCTSCHPVSVGADGKPVGKKLPNGFTGHQIELVAHDKLGEGDKACLVCHDDPAKDPGKLKLIDGSLVDVTGDVSSVCYRCHSAKYNEWKAGMHGKNLPKCTSGGCHNPHTPSWIYAGPMMPFGGTGFQVRAVSDREPFKPLASAPVPPPVETPSWLSLAATLGLIASVGIVGILTSGRLKR